MAADAFLCSANLQLTFIFSLFADEWIKQWSRFIREIPNIVRVLDLLSSLSTFLLVKITAVQQGFFVKGEKVLCVCMRTHYG